MGCCKGKKWLRMLAGLALILVSVQVLAGIDPWLIVGLFLLLAGLAPFVCQCDGCREVKKRK